MENVVIIGSGPAGYTAALYTARANLNPMVIEGFMWGGLLQETTDVENFPGFSDGITGPDLMDEMRAQAQRFGARLITDMATAVELADEEGGIHRVHVGDDVYETRTVILAMGAQHRRLGIPGETELAGRGVSYCATCDAAFFRDRQIVVVGGGDSAMEEAMFLAKFGRQVTVIHRRDEFRASPIMVDRARATGNLTLMTPYVPVEMSADESGVLSHVTVRHAVSGELTDVPASGAFVAVGHAPQSEIVAGQVQLDPEGYVTVEQPTTRTSRPGVFACGDLVDRLYRQAITAAGSGCRAALDCEWYLRDLAH
jgi:thioredoxin reductase (NADPH)